MYCVVTGKWDGVPLHPLLPGTWVGQQPKSMYACRSLYHNKHDSCHLSHDFQPWVQKVAVYESSVINPACNSELGFSHSSCTN